MGEVVRAFPEGPSLLEFVEWQRCASTTTIAHRLGISIDEARRQLKKLERAGYVRSQSIVEQNISGTVSVLEWRVRDHHPDE